MGPVIVRILFLLIHSSQSQPSVNMKMDLHEPWVSTSSLECSPNPQMNCPLRMTSEKSNVFYSFTTAKPDL